MPEVDVFLKFSCFFNDPVDAGNLISASSAFSKTGLNIWMFTVHVMRKIKQGKGQKGKGGAIFRSVARKGSLRK